MANMTSNPVRSPSLARALPLRPTDAQDAPTANGRWGRGMIAAAAVSSMVVPVGVDGLLQTRAHMGNPRWLPHAKLHCAMSFFGGISLGLGALAVLRSRPVEDKAAMATAAFLATAFWPGLIASGFLPGTSYDFADDPAVRIAPPRLLGKPVHVNVAIAALSTALGWAGYALTRSRTGNGP